MVIYRGSFLAPHSTRILEVADQLFLFAIHADDRQAAFKELLFLLGHIDELLVPLWAMVRKALGIGMQGITELIQEPPHGIRTNEDLELGEFRTNLP